ncbi:hypothetical protein FRX31_024764, partial [Thalictrum thalictroides]
DWIIRIIGSLVPRHLGGFVMFNAFSFYADHLIMGTCNEECKSHGCISVVLRLKRRSSLQHQECQNVTYVQKPRMTLQSLEYDLKCSRSFSANLTPLFHILQKSSSFDWKEIYGLGTETISTNATQIESDHPEYSQ